MDEKTFRVWVACEYSDTVAVVSACNELQARLWYLHKYRLQTSDYTIPLGMIMAEQE